MWGKIWGLSPWRAPRMHITKCGSKYFCWNWRFFRFSLKHQSSTVISVSAKPTVEVTANTSYIGRRWQGGADRRVCDGPCKVSPRTSPAAAMGLWCVRSAAAPWLHPAGTSAWRPNAVADHPARRRSRHHSVVRRMACICPAGDTRLCSPNGEP